MSDDGRLLRVEGLSKTFLQTTYRPLFTVRREVTQALADVSFAVRAGTVTALLGPNGAGKTTMINIICDLVRPDAGSVHVAGQRVPDPEGLAQRQIGLVTSDERSFFWRLTGRQNLMFFAALQGLSAQQARLRSDFLLRQFGLDQHADRSFRLYSAGTKKRLALARALLHDPPVLLMDEPTNALDPAATDDLLDFVKTEILPAGKSILWATHRLDEVMMLCDDVVLLIRGVLAFRGTVTELLELRKRGDSWRIDFYALDRDLEKISTFVKAIGGELQRGPSSFRLILRSGREQQDPAGVFSKLLDLGARIESLQPDVCSLNELFVDLLDTNGIV